MNFSDCNKILINTHRKDCIDLLKARDYFFNKSRNLCRLRTSIMLLPLFLMALTYIPFNFYDSILNIFRDYILSIVTFVSVVLSWSLQAKINRNLSISNTLREEYDLNVFEIKPNPFIYDRSNIEEYVKKAQYMPDDDKYEVWYSEIFCHDHYKNIICAQLDNCLYTYHVYGETRRIAYWSLSIIIAISMIVFINLFRLGSLTSGVLFLISISQILLYIIESIKDINNLIEDNKTIIDNTTILAQKQRNKRLTTDEKQHIIRSLQDCIIKNREHSLFILKYIRKKFLKNGNPYYVDLDYFREIFMTTEDAQMIESSADIPILSLSNLEKECVSSEDVTLVSMQEIHSHLLKMLADVKRVWEEYGIQYSLDGGTLIGAIREKSKMLFWDDDVDVILPYTQIDLAKKVIIERLGEKYEIQDFDNDEFYSPRLSNFRIREKNEISKVSEKDSPLYSLYKKRGLFIDVYTYSPIFINRPIDSICRHFLIHPLNKHLKRIEYQAVYSKDIDKREDAKLAFLTAKNFYLKVIRFYISISRNKKYVSYTPNYIYVYHKAGPYVKYEDMCQRIKVDFENDSYYVPVGYEKVLEASYGKNWNISPYKCKETLIKEATLLGNPIHWYSRNKFPISVLKHLTYVELKSIDNKE